MRLRRALNVESGLNDGIVTPIVVFTLAVAAAELGHRRHGDARGGRRAAGARSRPAVGLAVGRAAPTSSRSVRDGTGSCPAVDGWPTLAAALSSFALAAALDGNGFIAAFVAGIAFGAGWTPTIADVERADELPELIGEVLALAVWFLFGAVLVPVAFDFFERLDARLRRAEPDRDPLCPGRPLVIGSGLDRPTVLFWAGSDPGALPRSCSRSWRSRSSARRALPRRPLPRSRSPCC